MIFRALLTIRYYYQGVSPFHHIPDGPTAPGASMCMTFVRKYLCGCIWDELIEHCPEHEPCWPNMIILHANGQTCKGCGRRGDRRTNLGTANLGRRSEPIPPAQSSEPSSLDGIPARKREILDRRTPSYPSDYTFSQNHDGGTTLLRHELDGLKSRRPADSSNAQASQRKEPRRGPESQRGTAIPNPGMGSEHSTRPPARRNTNSQLAVAVVIASRTDGNRPPGRGEGRGVDDCHSNAESAAAPASKHIRIAHRRSNRQPATAPSDSDNAAWTPGVDGLGDESLDLRCPATPRLDPTTFDLDLVPSLWLEDEYHCDLTRLCDPVKPSSIRRDYRARRGRTDWYRIKDKTGEYCGPSEEYSELLTGYPWCNKI